MKQTLRILAAAATIGMVMSQQAQAKNMFYLLAASWCDKGGKKPTRFEIKDDGSLIYDASKGRVCQIKSATNMDQPMGDYHVTWRCDNGEVKENLTTFMDHDKNGGRRFFLIRKGKIFEQCEEQD